MQAHHAADLLTKRGFERILDLPVEPFQGPKTPQTGCTLEVDDTRWPVRAFGADVRLVQPAWPGQGIRRVYTLGWGLTPAGQTDCLVLAEAVGNDADLLRGEADALACDLSEAAFVARVVVVAADHGVVARVAAYPAYAPVGPR